MLHEYWSNLGLPLPARGTTYLKGTVPMKLSQKLAEERANRPFDHKLQPSTPRTVTALFQIEVLTVVVIAHNHKVYSED